MKLTMFAQLGRFSRQAWWGGALTGLLLAAGATAIGDVTPEGKRLRDAQRGSVSLFFHGPTAVLRGNQLQCGVDNQGNVCTDVFNSPTGGGGFWPTGSVNQYIFNTGLQIAGIHSDEAGPWANDTVAAYFFDARGSQQHSAPLQSVWDSQNNEDLAAWPAEAFVLDTDLFQPVLVGRKTASQQDSWTQYWDGDPSRNSNRKHPVGVKVTQRSLAWNFPSGNESVIYFIYNFENATGDPTFQGPNEAQFFGGSNALPDGGFRIDEMYASFSTDMDVSASAGTNFSTAILPFDLGLSYESSFGDATFTYPPNLFFPPFFTNAPGIVGVKYLRSPIDPATGQQVGLTLFSNTQNPSSAGAIFIDPFGDEQLWRYLSGNLDPAQGDPPCNVAAEIETGNPVTTQRSVCFVFQQSADTRFYQASGPFSLEAGQAGTIVVAYIIAATVQTMPDGTASGINPNSLVTNDNPPGFPSFHPGFQSDRGCDINGLNCTVSVNAAGNAPTAIERGSGWFQYTGAPPASTIESPTNKISQFDVTVVPGSLLGRALVAQTIFDNKFLLGFAPDAPEFFLVPGDGAVTVVWEASPSEAAGDPFFAVASDAGSALFNPNYRENDVEGYRVWRGTSPSNLTLMAQFDHSATTFTDFNCETVGPAENVGSTAVINGVVTPVVGFVAGETCGIGPGGLVRSTTSAQMIFNNGSEGGPAGGGIVRSADLRAVAAKTDTVGVTGVAAGPGGSQLTDTGIPFTFGDQTVVNNFTYFYAVSTFDLNSQSSGPSSLRSPRPAQAVVPRENASNISTAFSFDVALAGDDGVPLDVSGSAVQPDPATGIFPGPQPPTNATNVFFNPSPSVAGGLLEPGTAVATIDSIVPLSAGNNPCPAGSNARGMCWQAHLTIDNGFGSVTSGVVDGQTPFSNVTFGESSELNFALGNAVLPFADGQLSRVGIPAGFGAGVAVGVGGNFNVAIANSSAEALVNRFSEVPNSEPGGSRWFDGDTETLEHPTVFTKAGELAGIDTIYHPISHSDLGAGAIAPASGDMVCWPYIMSFLTRAADVQFTWGADTFDGVRDITHNVDVPFDSNPRTTWGFMTEDANGNGVIDWQDFDYLDGINQDTEAGSGPLNFFCALGDRGLVNPPLAQLTQTLGGLVPVSTEGIQPEGMTQTGTGFGLYVNGEHYIFQTSTMPAAGSLWTLRTYHGYVTANNPLTATPSGYALSDATGGATPNRLPMVAGLQFIIDIKEAGAVDTGTPDLSAVHTVPDPYLGTSRFDLSPTNKQLMFVNLPTQATIRIYSLTGKLVSQVEHNDPTGGGRVVWDMRNRNNQFVASGVYFFHVITPAGEEHVGKMTIVNFAGQN